MKPIERILAAIDLSEISEEVLKASSFLAEKIEETGKPPVLSVLHVVHQIPFEGHFFSPLDPILIQQIEEQAKIECEKKVQSFIRKNKTISTEVKIGIPSVDLIRFAKQHKVQFVVAGTHNRKGFERFFLGSVAETITKQSDCPVWIVKDKFKSPQKILLLTDFSQNSKSGFMLGLFLAKLFHASVHLLSVFELPFLPSYATIDTSEYELKMKEAAEEEFQKWLEEAKLAKLSVTGELREGRVADEIEKVVQEQSIDLLVMSTHGQTGLFHKFLGSTATKIIRQISCSFLTTHPENFRWKEIG